jgi:S-DNA-T family DNA segregation ATPase FtsK/SpoIIIE
VSGGSAGRWRAPPAVRATVRGGRLRGLESHLRYRLALRTFTAGESLAVVGTTASYELPAKPGAGLLAVDGRCTRFQAPLTVTADAPDGPTDLDRLVAEATDRRPPTTDPAQVRHRSAPGLPPSLSLDDAAREAGHRGGTLGSPTTPVTADASPWCSTCSIGPATSPWSVPPGAAVRPSPHAVVEHARRADPSRFQAYALDLGGGALAPLAGLPHCGAVGGPSEPGSVARVLRHLTGRLADPPATTGRAAVVLVVDDLARLRRELARRRGGSSTSRSPGGPRPERRRHRRSLVRRRPALLDALDVRLELRLAEPADRCTGGPERHRCHADPGAVSTWLADRCSSPTPLATSRPGHTAAAPSHRACGRLPDLVHEPALGHAPAEVGDCAGALGVTEPDLAEVRLDLLAPGEPFVVVGAAGAGPFHRPAQSRPASHRDHGSVARVHPSADPTSARCARSPTSSPPATTRATSAR